MPNRRNQHTTRRQRLSRRLAGSLVAFVSLASGCVAVFDYPPAEGESSARGCSDGTDNDFDGLIDCADPDCDGRCPENDPSTCADGRDNDGDGKTDAQDPRCWHLAAPSVVRCTSNEPVDFEERFDVPISDPNWFSFGLRATDGTASPLVQPPRDRPGRPDSVLGFALLPSAEQAPTGVVSIATFSGDWRSLSMGFEARVTAPGLLRIALVSAGQSGAVTAPPSPDLAPILIEVDARTSPLLRVAVSGHVESAPWPGGTDWHAVRLVTDGGALRLSVDNASVMQLESASLGTSRLAIWAQGDGQADELVQLDDLQLQLSGAFPCGVAVPQIPLGPTCRLDHSALNTNAGYTVSVASDESAGHCAVVSTGPLGQELPDGAQFWTSEHGAAWEQGGTIPFSAEDGQLIGVGVARDTQASLWRAALTWHADDAAFAGVSSSPGCGAWDSPRQVATLPQDAEAPSYLIPGIDSPYEIYFTRPAAAQGASLWRLSSADGVSFTLDPDPTAVFDAEEDVAGPAALTRAGNDFLLVHRISQSSGQLGVGLWVAEDDTLVTWRRAARWPFLEADRARGEFDADMILAGTIFWGRGNPTLFYGALGSPVASSMGVAQASTVTTGSALLEVSGDASPESSTSPGGRPGLCGDGHCAAEEDCDICSVDCGVCDGEALVVERFESGESLELIGLGNEAPRQTSMYVSALLGRLAMAPGPPAWLSRTIDVPLRGDFELSFDVYFTPPDVDAAQRCTALVGLAVPGTTSEVNASGLFLQLDRHLPCSKGAPAFAPHVRARGKRIDSVAPLSLVSAESDCVGAVTGFEGSWQRVRLTRRGGTISASVSVPGNCDWRADERASLDYAGPFDSFDRILIGWDRSAQPKGSAVDCSAPAALLTLDNVVLRTLPCQKGSECTDPETGRTFCTDLQSSPEHCGACSTPVGIAQVCSGGQPTCGETECVVPGSAELACADLQSDANHCGACNAAVGALETCNNGRALAQMVLMPEGFSIDATQVTRSQYAAWLATKPSTSEQLPECDWNETFEPTCDWPPFDRESWPVTWVDWCDASGYCASNGKRLCGRIGGGPGSNLAADPNNQWFAACSSGGKNKFPYGSTYDPLACNGLDRRPPDAPYQCALTLPVASLPTCQSSEPGYQGVYDMAGNVDEWVDGCTTGVDDEALCAYFVKNSCLADAATACDREFVGWQSESTARLGFRCCSL